MNDIPNITHQLKMFFVSAVPTILYGNSRTILADFQDDYSSYKVKLGLVIIFLLVSLQLARSKACTHLIAIINEDSCAHIL